MSRDIAIISGRDGMHIFTHTHFLGSVVHTWQNVCMVLFIRRFMSQQNVVYMENEIFHLQRKWSYNSYYNVDKYWKHYDEWNKKGTKGFSWKELGKRNKTKIYNCLIPVI